MQKSFTIGQFFYKHSYLLVVAAWLITISFVVDNYWSANASLKTVQKKVSGYIHEQESDFEALVANTSQLNKIAGSQYGEKYLQWLIQKPYFVFFYDNNNQLKCWNTQKILPQPFMLNGQEEKGFAQLDNGFYVWERREAAGLRIVTLIPVKWNYSASNEYLQNNFVFDPSLDENYDISFRPENAVVIKSRSGEGLFYIYERTSNTINKNNPVATASMIIAMLLFCFFIHLLAAYLAARLNTWIGWGFLLIAILLLRTAGYFFPVPMNFRQFELFDPAIYGSGRVLRSLGDLLINSVLFLWFVLFSRHYLQQVQPFHKAVKPVVKIVMLLFGIAMILVSTFVCSSIVRSIVADSQISFDVIRFFELSEYSIIGFIILSCIAVGYFFLCHLVLYFLKPLYPKNFIPLFLGVAIAGLALLSFKVGKISGGFEIYVLAWLLVFLLLLNSNVANLLSNKIVSSKFVFWLFFFSASITGVLIVENNIKELRNRRHYAEILAIKADPASETLINSMLTDFRPDFLADNFERFRNESENNAIKDSLIGSNTSGYTNKYDTHVYTYDANEQPLFNEDSTTYSEINAILNTQSKPTSVAGLYYFDQSFDMFSYLSKRTLLDTAGKTIGYVFIMASPKRFRRDALYPELFSKGQNNAIENSTSYAIAVYNNRKLISSHNDYPFPSVIGKKDMPTQAFRLEQKPNHSELWYYPGADKVVVIAKENSLSIESITLFSYLFCSFLLLSAFVWFLNVLIRARFNRKRFWNYWQLSIRNQIHGTIIFISVVSFLVIGIATIWFFVVRYEDNNREKLSRTIRIMEKEVKNALSGNWRLADTVTTREGDFRKQLGLAVDKVSEIHGVDVNVYNVDGNLEVSSLSFPYVKGILSTRMDPMAFHHLHHLKEIQFFQKEKIGNLEFMSNYVPVLDAGGNNYAYLNIPYFTSQSKLRQEISNFLVTIINLNAFIFLLAGIVALFITNRITNSFSVISDKMKKINLGTRNEAIEWKRDDEIGALVVEYNKMVGKLDESASILAKTEREGAWKEMARQVAHEIKNPLTPMKLSIQFLQKAIESNAPNAQELAQNVANTLVEQIDHLSQIANAFSQFAHIGDANKELFDMNDTLRNVLHLHAANDKLDIVQQLLTQPVMIEADKTHINRLFTNLVLNGIQSVPDDRPIRIEVKQSIEDGSVLTKITDNGQGIDEAIQSKIFAPNFTTKTSGTGLGLAMCKRIVEQAEGNIWFETVQGAGTSFFVKLPLAV